VANLTKGQRKIVSTIEDEARYLPPKLQGKFKRYAVQIGLVETNLQNLPYGDANSENFRQERKSVYGPQWAKTGGPLNTRAIVRRLRDEFLQQYDPGEKSYDVAAQVQRPAAQYRGRYHDVAGQAAEILRGTGGRTGGTTPAQSPAYRTVPGVDNSAQRDQLKLAYFENSHDPNALLELQAGLDQARDTPSRRVRVRGAQPQPSRGGKQRSFGVGGELHELFWNGPGAVNVKNGQRVPKGFVEGHTDHVHVAGGPKSVVALGLLAESMGLKVGENPRFGGVHPVHVEGSYHYKREAVDVSGPPKLLARFARRVVSAYGL
jgi:hypothetical protein